VCGAIGAHTGPFLATALVIGITAAVAMIAIVAIIAIAPPPPND
jgi:hypothetical protein